MGFKEVVNRRAFLKTAFLSSVAIFTAYSVDFGTKTKNNSNNNIDNINNINSINNLDNINTFEAKMVGDLDDDLFLVKASPGKIDMTHCFQMHNPRDTFKYGGEIVKSNTVYGTIDFTENLQIKDDEVLFAFVANEREELTDKPALRKRTHFKAVDFEINKQMLIPALLPEKNSILDYPKWFNSTENPDAFCKVDFKKEHKSMDYDYYKMWENAVCGAAIVLPYSGKIELSLFNDQGDKLFVYHQEISTVPANLISQIVDRGLFSSHLLAEIDGNVFNGDDFEMENEYIKQNAIVRGLLTFEGKTIEMLFPYPIPYPNRIYAMSLREEK